MRRGDGNLVAIGSSRHVQLFDTNKRKYSEAISTSNAYVLDVEFSPDNRFLAWAGRDGTLGVSEIRIGNAINQRVIHQARRYKDSINTLAWVDDRHLLTIDWSGIGQVIDLDTSRIIHRIEGMRPQPTLYAKIDPTGKWLAVSYGNQVQIWDLPGETKQCQFNHHPNSFTDSEPTYSVRSISFSPDGNRIATTGSVDGKVLVWDTATGRQLSEISHDSDSMGYSTAFSPDGQKLLCASATNSFVLDLNTDKQKSLGIARIKNAEWISGQQIVVLNANGLLGIFDVSEELAGTILSDQNHQAHRMAISPDGRTIVTSFRQTLSFWHVPSRRLIGTIPREASSLAFSADGSKLYLIAPNQESNSFDLRVISR